MNPGKSQHKLIGSLIFFKTQTQRGDLFHRFARALIRTDIFFSLLLARPIPVDKTNFDELAKLCVFASSGQRLRVL